MTHKNKVFTLLLVALLLFSFTACDNNFPQASTVSPLGTTPLPSSTSGSTNVGQEEDIIAVRRINSTDIEILYSDTYSGKTPRAGKFTVTADGSKKLPYNTNYGTGGSVYFDHILTVSLATPLADDAAVTIEHNGVTYDVPYEPYYQYKYISDCGIPVYGSRALLQGEESVKRGAQIVDAMLSASSEIVEQMIASGAKLAIYSKGEHAYYIPEHRSTYSSDQRYVEGLGGVTSSVTESNLWHWRADNAPDPSYTTVYINESVLVHEFAHGIKIAGIDAMEDQSLATEFQMVYRHAVASGLWPNSYAISNSDEFFATMSAIWFNVMNESAENDLWDGVRGPVNTRDELYNYDIVTYNFFAKIYPYIDLDGEWTPVPDTVTISGLSTADAPNYGSTHYTLSYPDTPIFMLMCSNAQYLLDTDASDSGIGLYWDYATVFQDTAGSRTYIFELIPGTQPTVENNVTTCTVYIKSIRDGYLYQNGSYICTAAVLDQLPNVPAAFELVIDENELLTIRCNGKYLAFEGKASNGTSIILSDENSTNFRLIDVTTSGGNVLFIHNGTVNGSENGAFLGAGAVVQICAPTTYNGKRFVRWESTAGTITDIYASSTQFVMPESDAVLWAIYE